MTAISDRLAQASSNGDGRPDHGSAGTPELFVYGTLAVDKVVRALIDRVPAHEDTSAPGWRAARLPELPYPGLVADKSAEAPGRVYTDLNNAEWSLLDAFEDPTYIVTTVGLRDGHRALAYVWPNETLDQNWSAASLDSNDLAVYLTRCRAWRARFEARQV
ncbi:gamma-glutamylcyclotransferase family protein [Actinomycetospora chibensis]|uniref:Putative gamma-glutamylcyclotransferase n=1 Tax=Actinomycetospora chibensis TaxID=663606 RepID=A0ABV9RPG0_9PSEU|nr:gamma-glutamylcyclotransferase family protein [Actinomycetospora chibensis]MDD7924307.1 gamma-glutamylcyclotransferase [Actinomycetospora chibensis]